MMAINHFSFSLICLSIFKILICLVPYGQSIDVNVGAILDFSSIAGKMRLTSINLALSDFNSKNPNSTTRLVLHVRDSEGDVVVATVEAFDLVHSKKVKLIFGPQNSNEAQYVAVVAAHAHVPVLSFSSTDTILSPAKIPYLIWTTPNKEAEAQAQVITHLITTTRSKRVFFIYEDSPEYSNFVPHIISEVGNRVRALRHVPVPSVAPDDRIYNDLTSLSEMKGHVFVVHTSAQLASRIFWIAKVARLMCDDYVWITTEAITNYVESTFNRSIIDSLQGVLGVRPYIKPSMKVRDFHQRWRSEFSKENINHEVIKPTAYELWTYDTVWAVMIALNHANMTNNSSIAGEKLIESIRKAKFEGMSGWFSIENGGLSVSRDYEVVEVGEDSKGFGTWTRKEGMMWRRSLKALVPAPVTGKLKIVIPGSVDPGFAPILQVDLKNGTNELVLAQGFVIDVFEAAVAELPYNLDYEYLPFVDTNGRRLGDYDKLIQQVSQKNYDAAVGDITITSDRMSSMEFTQPYMDSSVQMLVPLIERNDAWSFLLPWTWDLWFISTSFFLLTGFTLWALERNTENSSFRDKSWFKQIMKIMYLSFYLPINGSSGEEELTRDISRTVLAVWSFVLFILSSSYTANLASIFTTEQLKPSVTTIQELIKNQEYVGYLQDSYVKGVLLKQGFQESRLRPYTSPDQYAGALTLGSKNGGVAAIVDESPYLNLFLQYFCCNYTIPNQFYYQAGGFGFAFPTGSVLAHDFSMAILNLTESGRLAAIHNKWLSYDSSTQDIGSFSQLSADSFLGLFAITGSVSILAMIAFGICNTKKHVKRLRSATLRLLNI